MAGGALAAAACVGFAFLVVNLTGSPSVAPQPTGPIAGAAPEGTGDLPPPDREPDARSETTEESPAQPRLAEKPAHDEEAVLFAVYRGVDGSCECVQVNEPDWGETRLADVSRHELLRAGLQDACTTIAPEVVVIGVAGKRGTVLSSRDHAESVARRLGDQSLRGRDVASVAYAAMPDLPAGTMVVAERLSIRP